MNEFKRVLRHYGLTKAQSNRPDWLDIQNRLGINIARPTTANKKSLVWTNYVTTLKNRIYEKYQRDTKIVRVNYRFPYVARLKNGELRNRVYRGNIRGARENIQRILRDEIQNIIEGLRESDVDIDDDVVAEIIGEEEIPVELGGNGIRKVKGVRVARMRYGRAYKLDDDYDDGVDFDRGVGTCCFDLLYHLYSPSMKRNMPDRETAYQGIVDFLKTFYQNPPDFLEEGLNIDDLKRFCKANDITIIALDKDEECLVYEKGKNRNRPALIFRIANNHIYPIFNKDKRNNIVKKNNEQEKHSSNSVEGEKKKDKQHTIIEKVGEETAEEKALRVIKERDTIPKDIGFDTHNCIDRLVYENEVLHLQEAEPEVLEAVDVWKGENYVSMTMANWVDYKKDIELASVFSPQVQEVFELQNIKNRTQYGCPLSDEDISLYMTRQKIKYVEKHTEVITENYNDIHTGELRTSSRTITHTTEVEKEGKTLLIQKQEKGEIICFDINKAYPHALSNPLSPFLIYTEEDSFVEFDGELKNGLYAVETNDITLLRLSNIYTGDILRLASENGIQYKILKQLIPKKKKEISPTLFKDFFESMNEKYEGKRIVKLINNTLTGILGKTSSTRRITRCDQDKEEVWRYLFGSLLKHNNDNLISDTLGEGEDAINIFGYEIKNKLNEHTLPIYIQILDWANIQLYKLTQLVGGKVLFRHTDCIVVDGGKIPTDRLTDKWGDYKLENKVVRLESKARFDNGVKFNFKDDDWNIFDIIDSDEHKRIIELATERGGLKIQGSAGNGKSYVVKKELGVWEGNNLVAMNNDVIAVSFTNKASNGIKGTTIHKALRIQRNNKINKKSIERFKFAKYVVIDEIGMVPSYLWTLLKYVKQTYPHLIFILCGDKQQLTPVNEDGLDVFNHPIVKFLCHNNMVELKVPHRFNMPLWNFLKRGYEEGDWRGLKEGVVDFDTIYNSKNICKTNDVRRKINKACMEHFKELTDAVYLPAPTKIVNGEEILTYEKSQNVWLYNGLPIMSVTNNSKLEIINSEEFNVLDYDDEKIRIEREGDGEGIEISIDDFHKLFVANYCATTHKSQGATYENKVLIWEWEKMINDRKMCYTACSRATDIDNLIICRNII